jgi:FANCI helical domain 2
MDDEDDNESLSRLTSLLDRLSQRYSACAVLDLGFDPADNYDRKTEEGGKHCCQLEVLLTLYEALMEFVTVHGADRELRMAEQLLG